MTYNVFSGMLNLTHLQRMCVCMNCIPVLVLPAVLDFVCCLFGVTNDDNDDDDDNDN